MHESRKKTCQVALEIDIMEHKIGQRISVIGTSGSGKTTLARQLAERLGCQHVELDALNWEADWEMAPTAVFQQRVTDALQGDSWTVDGNYSRVRELIWSKADTVVWLDYSLPRIYWQLTQRTIRRVVSREKLWGTNREQWGIVFSRDSIFLWVWNTYGRRRREYPVLLAEEGNGHLTAVILKSPRQTQKWLASIN